MNRLEHYLGRSPDGRELFRYRIPDERYIQLRQFLRRELGGELADVDRETCALFCVFAAEWWRREHESGPWTWDGIKHALAVDDAAYSSVARAVDRGLPVLRRPLLEFSSGARARLVTVACEGGLPLRRLQVGGARLRTYFRDVLEHLEALGMSGNEDVAELEQVAARYDHRLPASLRREVVYRLTAELLGRAWSFRQSLSPDVADPVATLDVTHPGWRERLPLVIEDRSAEALLRGLMKDVARVASGRGTRLRVLASLKLGGDVAQLTRSLDVPSSLTDEELQRALGVPALPTGNRLQVSLRAEGGDTTRCGVLSRAGHASWSSQPIRGASFVGPSAQEMIAVVVATRGGAVESHSMEGAAPLGPLPWVFRRSPGSIGKWDLVARGSTRRQEPELIVAVPAGSSVEGEFEPVEPLLADRTLCRVTGEVRVHTEAGLVRVVGAAGQTESPTYELRGRRFEKVSSSRTAWQGMPQLVRRLGVREEPADLEVRRGELWTPVRGSEVGELHVRALVHGEVVFRDRIRVVPRDLTLKLEVGDRSREGAVCVSSEALVQVGVPDNPSWISEVVHGPTGYRVGLRATGPVPSRVPLTLVFRDGLLKGAVPFPQRTLHFETPDGSVIDPRTQFHIKRLGGIRAVGLSPRLKTAFAVTLEARRAGSGPVPSERTFQLVQQPTGEHILDLRDIQAAALEILDATERLDASVRIRLWELGGSARSTYIEAKRYDWTLQRDEATGDVLLVGPDLALAEDVVVEARPFCDVARVEPLPRLRSPRLGGARWVFDPAARAACTWLVTAREGSWYRSRPVPFFGHGEVVEPDGLRASFELPEEPRRHDRIRVVLDGMCSDWNHPDWAVVDGYLRLLGDLPAATFDLIRVIAHHPRAAAMVALRAAGWGAADFLQVMDGFEELVFLWEAVPLGVWQATFDVLLSAFPASLSEHAFGEVVARATTVGAEFPSVSVALHHWARASGNDLDGDANPELPIAMTFDSRNAPMLLGMRLMEVEDMVRRRAEEQTWPTPCSDVVLSDVGDLAVARAQVELHRRRVLDAPAVLARAALGEIELSLGETLFLEEVRSFDEEYFRKTFLFTFFALVARRQGGR